MITASRWRAHHPELMPEGKHLGAELGVGAGADEHEIDDEAHELVGEAEKRGDGSCPMTHDSRRRRRQSVTPPRPERRHSNRRSGCYGTGPGRVRRALQRAPTSSQPGAATATRADCDPCSYRQSSGPPDAGAGADQRVVAAGCLTEHGAAAYPDATPWHQMRR